MSIKRYISNKDNTISTALKENLTSRASLSNMGASDILEFFSIYGQASSASLEQARIIMQFPVSDIASDRTSGALKAKNSDTFFLKLSSVAHSQTTPKQYTVSVSPLVRTWDEGRGLDMESYLDLDASNWLSASDNITWANAGGDFASLGHISSSSSPMEFTTYIEDQDDDISLDITSLVEDWLSHQNSASTTATGSIKFSGQPTADELILLYSHTGTPKTFQFKAGTTGSADGNLYFVDRDTSAAAAAASLRDQINVAFAGELTASVSGDDNTLVDLTQSAPGYYGNTIVSSSKPSEFSHVTPSLFGGTGAINYGVVVRLSGSSEDGTNKESYYTKKIFSRTSQFFFHKPHIEARFDKSINDDRSVSYKSSDLATEADNINRIYLYNKQRSGLSDIPNTGSYLLVELVPTVGTAGVTLPVGGGVGANARTFITASRHSLGVYEAQFTYSGTESSLVDIWQTTASVGGHTHVHTGSQVTIISDNLDSHYEIGSFSTNITNLKPSYGSKEKINLRVYTRDKTIAPTVYTVASTKAPVSLMRNSYYQIKRVSDNYVVIPYTTGSTPQYSKMSYDMSGSFFEIDMSLLEPNYGYEISFLRQDGPAYVEQQERFKFRVDP